jgi:hypothetical protein
MFDDFKAQQAVIASGERLGFDIKNLHFTISDIHLTPQFFEGFPVFGEHFYSAYFTHIGSEMQGGNSVACTNFQEARFLLAKPSHGARERQPAVDDQIVGIGRPTQVMGLLK